MGKTLGLGSLWVFMFAVFTEGGRKNLNLVSRGNVVVNKGKLSLNNLKAKKYNKIPR